LYTYELFIIYLKLRFAYLGDKVWEPQAFM